MSDADYEERLKTTGRNDRCPCGSGKKYKKCHLVEDESKRSEALKVLAEQTAAAAAEGGEGAEAEDDTKVTDKTKRSATRQRNQSGRKGQPADPKQTNIPRRGAV